MYPTCKLSKLSEVGDADIVDESGGTVMLLGVDCSPSTPRDKTLVCALYVGATAATL